MITKNAVQAARTMSRGSELAYAGAAAGSGMSKASTATRSVEIGNLAREGASSTREIAASVTEKSVAKDMSPRVQPKTDSILSAQNPVQAFETKFGKKAVQNMSDQELAQSLANRADKTGLGEFGPRVGREKHDYAKKVFNRYQRMTGERPDLVAEKRYKNGKLWDKGMGLDSSVMPDLYNPTTGEVFDYKFGNAELGKNQIQRYEKTLPKRSDGSVSTPTQIKPTIESK